MVISPRYFCMISLVSGKRVSLHDVIAQVRFSLFFGMVDIQSILRGHRVCARFWFCHTKETRRADVQVKVDVVLSKFNADLRMC